VVAANVVMLFLLVGGYMSIGNIKQEVFPEFDLDLIIINVPYPGASPEEVEQGIVLAVEEAVRGIDDVKEIKATALEGFGVVVVELQAGSDSEQILNDVKAAIDRITSFPEDSERPTVFLATNRRQGVSMVI
jgi:multidrug efflux pump subunit AcrB